MGSFLSFIMVTQVILGIFLSFYYEASNSSFYVMIKIHLETFLGSFFHLMHLSSASIIFFLLYAHMLKGLCQGSFYKFKVLWASGYSMFLFSMMAAFLGYVLPWGQMSLWGATVITNLLSVLPMGNELVIWIWGGYFISNYTLKIFFSLHFMVPLVLLLLVLVHLVVLHYLGSSNPLGADFCLNKMEFAPNFLLKDALNFSAMLFIWGGCLMIPYFFSESENFLVASTIVSPLHIKPEWYFLQFYSILRAIPNKVGGVVAFFMSVLATLCLVGKQLKMNINSSKIWLSYMSLYVTVSVVLVYLGASLIEHPFSLLGQIFTFLYFLWFILVFLI